MPIRGRVWVPTTHGLDKALGFLDAQVTHCSTIHSVERPQKWGPENPGEGLRRSQVNRLAGLPARFVLEGDAVKDGVQGYRGPGTVDRSRYHDRVHPMAMLLQEPANVRPDVEAVWRNPPLRGVDPVHRYGPTWDGRPGRRGWSEGTIDWGERVRRDRMGIRAGVSRHGVAGGGPTPTGVQGAAQRRHAETGVVAMSPAELPAGEPSGRGVVVDLDGGAPSAGTRVRLRSAGCHSG